jgi:hypothetical protein
MKHPSFEDHAPELAGRLLSDTRLPSFFCGGLRLFDAALSSLPEDSMRLRFSTIFNYLIENFVKFRHIYSISETAGLSWLEIVTNRTLSGFCSFLLVSAPKIFPDASSAAFPAIVPCLPHILNLVIGHELYQDITEKLLGSISQLETSPPSVFLTKILIKLIIVRAEKMPREERRGFVLGWFSGWVSSVGKEDCYELSELVCEVCAAMLKVNGLTMMIPFLTRELLGYAPRFFPVFVGVSKFVKRRIVATKHVNRVPVLRNEFTVAGKEMRCRAHSMAMTLMVDGGKIPIDLARFEEDCEESQRIIQELKVQERGRTIGTDSLE